MVGPGALKPKVGDGIKSRRPLSAPVLHSFILLFFFFVLCLLLHLYWCVYNNNNITQISPPYVLAPSMHRSKWTVVRVQRGRKKVNLARALYIIHQRMFMVWLFVVLLFTYRTLRPLETHPWLPTTWSSVTCYNQLLQAYIKLPLRYIQLYPAIQLYLALFTKFLNYENYI